MMLPHLILVRNVIIFTMGHKSQGLLVSLPLLVKKYWFCFGFVLGGCPNLHFRTLHGTQIYTTHIYTKPKFTQPQIYTGPKFTCPQIYTTSNLQNPDLHKPRYTQPQIYTKPKFPQSQYYTDPNFTTPKSASKKNLHQIIPNISFKGKDILNMYYVLLRTARLMARTDGQPA